MSPQLRWSSFNTKIGIGAHAIEMTGTEMTPVFIGGCGRSGTTLLGSILGAHSDCLCVPESPFKTDILRHYDPAATNTRQLLSAILETRRFKLWGLDTALLRQSLDATNLTYADGLLWLVAKYGECVGKPAARFWIDHTPANVRSAVTLSELFPRAKFIHIVRDGRGVASSILPLDWGPNTIDGVADWWTESVAYGLAAESWGGTERVARVRYEDLVLSFESTVRKLCSFVGLDFQPAMLKADGFKVPGYTTTQHALVGSVPQPSRVNAWERSLAARQIEIFEAIAGELLRYLGYELKYGLKARKATRAEKWLFAIQDLYSKKLVNKVRLNRRRAVASY
jgi:hypothetical protein